MNTHDHDTPSRDAAGPGDADLPMQLRGLRGEHLPQRDLWPGIAARLAQRPASPVDADSVAHDVVHDVAHDVVPLRRSRALRLAPFALAASLVLAIGVSWQQRPDAALAPAGAEATMIQRQAHALTREYEGALRELQAAGTPAAPAGATLEELDRSAEQIRTALARDPDARFLLDQLRRTYEKRLELTQRATLS